MRAPLPNSDLDLARTPTIWHPGVDIWNSIDAQATQDPIIRLLQVPLGMTPDIPNDREGKAELLDQLMTQALLCVITGRHFEAARNTAAESQAHFNRTLLEDGLPYAGFVTTYLLARIATVKHMREGRVRDQLHCFELLGCTAVDLLGVTSTAATVQAAKTHRMSVTTKIISDRRRMLASKLYDDVEGHVSHAQMEANRLLWRYHKPAEPLITPFETILRKTPEREKLAAADQATTTQPVISVRNRPAGPLPPQPTPAPSSPSRPSRVARPAPNRRPPEPPLRQSAASTAPVADQPRPTPAFPASPKPAEQLVDSPEAWTREDELARLGFDVQHSIELRHPERRALISWLSGVTPELSDVGRQGLQLALAISLERRIPLAAADKETLQAAAKNQPHDSKLAKIAAEALMRQLIIS
jgi:hypothetical protein